MKNAKLKMENMSAVKYFGLIAIVTAIFLGFLYISPNLFNDYTITVLGNVYIFIILAVSYNLINGVTGQFSLEPNGFVAIGAYVTALLMLSPEVKADMYMIADPYPFIKDVF